MPYTQYVNDFQEQILKMVGLEGKNVKKLVLTIQIGHIPILETVQHVDCKDPTEITKKFKLIEMPENDENTPDS